MTISTVTAVNSNISPTKNCSVERCENKYYGRGLCEKHCKALWYQENKERELNRTRLYRKTHQEQISKREQQYYQSNKNTKKNRDANLTPRQKTRKLNATRRWRERNLDKIRIRMRERTRTDINFRLRKNVRVRIYKLLKRGSSKAVSAVKDLGCTVCFFKGWIEQHWLPNMSWENWGNGPGKWNIDHHIPLSSADLSVRDEKTLAVLHYTNQFPMWFVDNMRKSSRIPTP